MFYASLKSRNSELTSVNQTKFIMFYVFSFIKIGILLVPQSILRNNLIPMLAYINPSLSVVLVVQACGPRKANAGRPISRLFWLQNKFRIILDNLLRLHLNIKNKMKAWNIDEYGNTCQPCLEPLIHSLVLRKSSVYLPYLYSPTVFLQCT